MSHLLILQLLVVEYAKVGDGWALDPSWGLHADVDAWNEELSLIPQIFVSYLASLSW